MIVSFASPFFVARHRPLLCRLSIPSPSLSQTLLFLVYSTTLPATFAHPYVQWALLYLFESCFSFSIAATLLLIARVRLTSWSWRGRIYFLIGEPPWSFPCAIHTFAMMTGWLSLFSVSNKYEGSSDAHESLLQRCKVEHQYRNSHSTQNNPQLLSSTSYQALVRWNDHYRWISSTWYPAYPLLLLAAMSFVVEENKIQNCQPSSLGSRRIRLLFSQASHSFSCGFCSEAEV